ncbi:hypothetical protein MIND_00557800 [Mycena indigotica]|uniref:Uncharacterized protein n=1 Tax=Mycena indigotica TaxID=2126181 RepID=A0A8H6SY83_9AGAR|nr:uncharacterized protein MIND_00557800 [Mycena indigotica]KAF7307626.1 hypothetical protein MIND_00557800 [Mycena indigotica]
MCYCALPKATVVPTITRALRNEYAEPDDTSRDVALAGDLPSILHKYELAQPASTPGSCLPSRPGSGFSLRSSGHDSTEQAVQEREARFGTLGTYLRPQFTANLLSAQAFDDARTPQALQHFSASEYPACKGIDPALTISARIPSRKPAVYPFPPRPYAAQNLNQPTQLAAGTSPSIGAGNSFSSVTPVNIQPAEDTDENALLVFLQSAPRESLAGYIGLLRSVGLGLPELRNMKSHYDAYAMKNHFALILTDQIGEHAPMTLHHIAMLIEAIINHL